jgi:hypothetical protein
MTKAALGAGGLVGGGALLAMVPGVASATSSNDVAILNFALTLEYLEAKFYGTAISLGTVGKGPEREFAMTAYRHETEHVAFLKKALGSAAIKEPTFDFGMATGKTEFVKTAIKLEDTGVRASDPEHRRPEGGAVDPQRRSQPRRVDPLHRGRDPDLHRCL